MENRDVVDFWEKHPVNQKIYTSAEESVKDLEYRSSIYPGFYELMGLYGDHTGQTVLDFGCGPGNDLVGFTCKAKAALAIGVDISGTALALARARLAVHGATALLFNYAEANAIRDSSVNYVHSCGAIHHSANPKACLRFIYRVMAPGATGRLMVYNYDSIWAHLYVAYYCMCLNGKFKGMDLRSAMSLTTDTAECPIAIIYKSEEFLNILREIGFSAKYLGGYYAIQELNFIKSHFADALACKTLAEENLKFLEKFDLNALTFDGRMAGIGGVYHVEKP